MSNRNESGQEYEQPTIIRHGAGMANRFGRGNGRPVVRSIEGVGVADLISEFGTPLFVFSERRLRRQYRQAHRAFAVRYPRVRLCWSYKTNYLDAVCRIFHQEGAWAEVVSEMEYEMARRLGVPGDRIVYNGPYKPAWSLRRALVEGARVQLDHYDELYLAEQIAGELGHRLPVSIRVNLDTGLAPRWDRFGFNLDNGEALQAARRIGSGGRLLLDGLHCHLGTFILDPRAYATSATKVSALARQIREHTGMMIRHLNLGGGLASCATLHAQYAPGDDCSPSFDDYADAICTALVEAGAPAVGTTHDLPALYLESGRALVDDAGTLLTRVVGNKRLANGSRSMIIDAGLNLLFTSLWYRHQVLPAVDRGGLPEETVVHGPLCMNIDVVRPSVLLPAMEVGDPLVIRPVGAYNVTQWMQFIRERPPVVLIGEQGQVDLIRQPETVETIKQPEVLPQRLAPDRSYRAAGSRLVPISSGNRPGGWGEGAEGAAGLGGRRSVKPAGEAGGPRQGKAGRGAGEDTLPAVAGR